MLYVMPRIFKTFLVALAQLPFFGRARAGGCHAPQGMAVTNQAIVVILGQGQWTSDIRWPILTHPP
jgi:hypothetical protein